MLHQEKSGDPTICMGYVDDALFLPHDTHHEILHTIVDDAVIGYRYAVAQIPKRYLHSCVIYPLPTISSAYVAFPL
jgi:hypothetical protein